MALNFIKYLQKNIIVNAAEEAAIIDNNKTLTFEKGDFIVKEGAYCEQFFFVESGLLRQYVIAKNGKEHIIHFASENWFIGDRESKFFNQPAVYNIQCLEPTVLYMLDEEILGSIFKTNDSYKLLFTKLLHNHIRHLQKRITQLLSASAEERYLDFVEMHPNIMQRVPQSMIAAYLGIAPESLSRVRKELTQHK